MSDSHLIEAHQDGVATLTMNRPESLNAFSGEMTQKLQAAIPRLADDDSVRVVVLTGAGRAFSAGGDVKGMAGERPSTSMGGSQPDRETPLRPTLEQRVAGLRRSTEIVEILYRMPKPTIAAIPGVVAGGGFSLALSCDIRLCNTSARFTTAFAKLGLSGDYGGSYFLQKLVGAAKAKELYFGSEIIGATEAHELGIVNHVYPDTEFLEKSSAFAAKIASMPPLALRYMKRNINTAEHASLGDLLDLEAANITRCFDTEDHKAGARAFVTKEAPVFQGR